MIRTIEYGKKKKVTEYENTTYRQLQGINLKELTVSSKLSTGQFGDLFLINDKTGNEYVAKTMSKG